jgi:hypothetical protein
VLIGRRLRRARDEGYFADLSEVLIQSALFIPSGGFTFSAG